MILTRGFAAQVEALLRARDADIEVFDVTAGAVELVGLDVVGGLEGSSPVAIHVSGGQTSADDCTVIAGGGTRIGARQSSLHPQRWVGELEGVDPWDVDSDDEYEN